MENNLKRQFMEAAKSYASETNGGVTVNNPKIYKAYREGQDNAYELLEAENKSLREANERMKEALKGIIDNWEERMSGDKEQWKDARDSVSGYGYYSPSASMVSSEFIANARKALQANPNT